MPSSKWRSERSGPNWLMDEQGRLIGYRDELGNEYKMPNEPAAGGISDNDEPSSSVSGAGNIRDFTDLQQAAADLANADTVQTLTITPGVTITLESPLSINTATMDLDASHAVIQGGNITGSNKALTLGFSFPDYNGWRRYAFTPAIRNLRLIGPGVNFAADFAGGACTAGIYTDGTLGAVNRAVRPKLHNPFIHGFDVAYEMGDVSFLGLLTDGVIDMCGIGLAQRAATDSGEMVMLDNMVIQRTMLPYLLQDGSSEVVHKGGSIDYGAQVCVINTGSSWGALTLDNVHWETRGAYDGSDELGYPVNGSGADPRALIPGRDAVFDIDGVGSRVIMIGGLADLNTNGLNPAVVLPWSAIRCLIKTRNKNAAFLGRDVSPQNLANTNQLLHSGIGHVEFGVSRLMFPSDKTLPARKSDNPIHNRLKHGSFPASLIEDLWTIRRDTAEITNRWTGTNGSLGRDNSVTRAITIAPALTLSGTGTGVQTVTSTVDAFTPDMLGRNFVVGSGVGSITSVDGLRQMTLNVSAAFASTAIAAGAAMARNTASLRVSKVGAAGTNFEAACLIGVEPGKIVTVHGWYWIKASGGLTGVPALNLRWGKKGMPKVAALAGAAAANYLQTIPTEGYADTAGADWDLGAGREANVIRTIDLGVGTTNTWIEFVLTVPAETVAGYGSMQRPEWADCIELGVNLNGANAGDLNLTDITVSVW